MLTPGEYADYTLTVKITAETSNSNFNYYAHTRSSEGDREKLYIGRAGVGYTDRQGEKRVE